jgi:membrane-associated protein
MDWIMNFIRTLLDYAIHIDEKLPVLFNNYGSYAFAIIFLVIFCETGLVVTPFLPGDSLIFAIGAVAKMANLNIVLAYLLLITAAVTGNLVNYCIGHTIGQKIFEKETHRFIKVEYLIKTQAFYDKHGGIAIILSRFMPIIRTFAPFVAGIGKMNFLKFFIYNLIGGFSWVTLLLFSGYFFGTIPFVKSNFEYVILAILVISLLPAIIAALRAKFFKKTEEES